MGFLGDLTFDILCLNVTVRSDYKVVQQSGCKRWLNETIGCNLATREAQHVVICCSFRSYLADVGLHTCVLRLPLTSRQLFSRVNVVFVFPFLDFMCTKMGLVARKYPEQDWGEMLPRSHGSSVVRGLYSA